MAFALFLPSLAQAVPYAAFSAHVDGDPGEWATPVYAATVDERDAAPAARNRLDLRVAWTFDALLVTGTMADADLHEAPADLEVEQFHQYDSVQVYVDPLDDSHERMNGDDVDLLLLPDGRSGVLRGDDLVAELVEARVPQRRTAPLAHRYAARRVGGGWQFELAVPWASLGRVDARGARIKVDIAMNDWVVAHAPAAETGFDARTLREDGVAPAGPAEEVGVQVFPLNWDGGRDFGYPSRWRGLRLSGDAPLLERAVRAFGVPLLLTVVAAIAVLVIATVVLLMARRVRRRMHALMAQLRTPAPLTASATTSGPDAPRASAPLDPRDRAFAERVLAHVRGRLADDLAPSALAAAMNVSLRSLQRRLRDGIGTTPQELVLAARLEAAHALLREGRLRVGEVAFQVGFDDLSHFSRRFRAVYGVPPSRVIPAPTR